MVRRTTSLIEVIAHFRNLRTIGSISSEIRVTVFDPVFEDRSTHLQAVLALLPAFERERCIVFLDPDTGLNPEPKPGSRPQSRGQEQSGPT